MPANSLAIIGAGSSGLVTLKIALTQLNGWTIECFERSSSVQGCWGNPYPGFVSTSTKFTTQFSCFQKYDNRVSSTDETACNEFFKDNEYGLYLEDFARTNRLFSYISLNTKVTRVVNHDGEWTVHYDDGSLRSKKFSHLIVCTGLTEVPKSFHSEIPTLRNTSEIQSVTEKTIIVMGGGESAADIANQLAAPSRKNKVYLSLRGGIRVSPRYHPIRGVPSDFLRNRLMLSIHEDLRNHIGQKFVETRIKHQEIFQRIFRNRDGPRRRNGPISTSRKHWDALLTANSKDKLFNVFHNKSDGFLDAVAEGRIRIIGSPIDSSGRLFRSFDGKENLTVDPDFIFPKLGYTSGIAKLFDGSVQAKDFYWGCRHVFHKNLFLVGFARPIIGNIPTISEQQAKYIIYLIQNKDHGYEDLRELYEADRKRLTRQFPTLNLETIYPVEMFPYCDQLARKTGTYPSLRKLRSLRLWIKVQLSPASTTHYVDKDFDPKKITGAKIHVPPIFNGLLLMVKLFDVFLGNARRAFQ